MERVWEKKKKMGGGMLGGGLGGGVMGLGSRGVYGGDGMLEMERKEKQMLTEMKKMVWKEGAGWEGEVEVVECGLVLGKRVEEVEVEEEVKGR